MTNKEIIDELDFSGGVNSFFDFWHLHVDFDGDGNQSWEVRKKYIDEQIELFKYIMIKLVKYPKPFQLWIGIDETDSSQDGIYIHTPNPNDDYFPHQIDSKAEKTTKESSELLNYLYNTGFALIESKNIESDYHFLFDESCGITLKK